jgi:sulfur-oxidizing protein SoxX
MRFVSRVARIGASVAAAAAIAGGACASSRAAAATPSDSGLPPYTVVGDTIPMPLTTQPGNAAAGKAVIENSKLGNCLSCHAMALPDADQGNVGPDLHGVGSALSPAQLRLRIVNMKLVDPTTIMPAYYRVDGLNDVAKAYVGKPILTAQQVEDVVAFLATSTTGATR